MLYSPSDFKARAPLGPERGTPSVQVAFDRRHMAWHREASEATSVRIASSAAHAAAVTCLLHATASRKIKARVQKTRSDHPVETEPPHIQSLRDQGQSEDAAPNKFRQQPERKIRGCAARVESRMWRLGARPSMRRHSCCRAGRRRRCRSCCRAWRHLVNWASSPRGATKAIVQRSPEFPTQVGHRSEARAESHATSGVIRRSNNVEAMHRNRQVGIRTSFPAMGAKTVRSCITHPQAVGAVELRTSMSDHFTSCHGPHEGKQSHHRCRGEY